MTFHEAINDLKLKTVLYGFSPFCTEVEYPANQVPCCKVCMDGAIYILMTDKSGVICCWKWSLGDPRRITLEEVPEKARSSDSWFRDTWLIDDSPYNVADWYKENGWPVH